MSFGGILAGAIGGAAKGYGDYAEGEMKNQQRMDLEKALSDVIAERAARVAEAQNTVSEAAAQRSGARFQQAVTDATAARVGSARDQAIASANNNPNMPDTDRQALISGAQDKYKSSLSSPSMEDYMSGGIKAGQLSGAQAVDTMAKLYGTDAKMAMLGQKMDLTQAKQDAQRILDEAKGKLSEAQYRTLEDKLNQGVSVPVMQELGKEIGEVDRQISDLNKAISGGLTADKDDMSSWRTQLKEAMGRRSALLSQRKSLFTSMGYPAGLSSVSDAPAGQPSGQSKGANGRPSLTSVLTGQ